MNLMNLKNVIDKANVQSVANFNGGGTGSNHVKTLNGLKGSTLNFGLQNLQNLENLIDQATIVCLVNLNNGDCDCD